MDIGAAGSGTTATITGQRSTSPAAVARVVAAIVLVLGLVFAAMVAVRASGVTCRDFSLDLARGAVGTTTAREAFDQWRVHEGPFLVGDDAWTWRERDDSARASYWHWHVGLRKVEGTWFTTSNRCR